MGGIVAGSGPGSSTKCPNFVYILNFPSSALIKGPQLLGRSPAMTSTSEKLRSVARQALETELLFGTNFIPRRSGPIGQLPASESGTPVDKPVTLAEVESRFAARFPVCESLSGATQPVFGEGSPEAELVFVGEAPGADEDRLGRPFVGAAGRKLDDIISAMGLSREAVYIANILKARPPGNRNPLPDEIAAHAPFLVEQLKLIQPRVIVALGRPAAHFLLETNDPISRLRGSWGIWSHEGLEVPVMPTFHPAYLLRQYTVEVRTQVWNDMQKVLKKLEESLR